MQWIKIKQRGDTCHTALLCCSSFICTISKRISAQNFTLVDFNGNSRKIVLSTLWVNACWKQFPYTSMPEWIYLNLCESAHNFSALSRAMWSVDEEISFLFIKIINYAMFSCPLNSRVVISSAQCHSLCMKSFSLLCSY